MPPPAEDELLPLIVAADRIHAHGHAIAAPCADCVPLLEAIVALYGGPLLAGFSLSDSPDFDDWLLFEAKRLQRLQADALTALIGVYQQNSQPVTALSYAQRLVALDPLHEQANHLLIAMYRQSHQAAAAQRHYGTFANVLHEAFNAEPAEATTALIRDLTPPKRDDPRPPRVPEVACRDDPLPASAPLIGRAHELDAIGNLLDDPTCRLLTLLGPGGSGKTQLALTLPQTRHYLSCHTAFSPHRIVNGTLY